MKKLAMLLMAGVMSFGLTGCLDDVVGSNDCSYFGNSGGCTSSFPYSCPQANNCYTTSSACASGGEC